MVYWCNQIQYPLVITTEKVYVYNYGSCWLDCLNFLYQYILYKIVSTQNELNI